MVVSKIEHSIKLHVNQIDLRFKDFEMIESSFPNITYLIGNNLLLKMENVMASNEQFGQRNETKRNEMKNLKLFKKK